MTALDEAIAAHAAHGAGACADPLTDSLVEQCARFSDLPASVHLRPGWEHEVPEPRVHRGLAALVFVATLLVCWLLSGCGGGDEPCRSDFAGPATPEVQALPLCPDDGQGRVTPPNCTTHPERCR